MPCSHRACRPIMGVPPPVEWASRPVEPLSHHESGVLTLLQNRRSIVIDRVAIGQENKGGYRPDEGDTGGDETADGHAIHEGR